MSQGKPIPLADGEPIARRLRTLLEPACTRIEVAGSIRRQKPLVADIEIVAIARIDEVDGGDLWATKVEVDQLEHLLVDLSAAGVVTLRDVENHRADGTVDTSRRNGPRYKALVFEGLPVDLFIVRPPADWGVIFALRTGPGDWNTRLVTDCKRFMRRVENDQVWDFGKRIPCPEEADFFRALGQPWVEPPDRRVSRVDLRQRLEATA